MRLKRSILVLLCAAAPQLSQAQTATLSGSLSAFDVVNETGQDAHGFEIQLEGATQGDLYYTVYGQRYGNPTVVPYATGVYIRYQSTYDPNSKTYLQTTPQHTPGVPFGWQDCYQGGINYATSGCEHFGQTLHFIPPTRTITVSGRWMVDDVNNPGNLVALNPPAAIPFATWFIGVPTTIGAPPAAVTVVEAPEPPETPDKYGDAQWTKIYTTQLTQSLTADQLTSDNPNVVPENPAQLEVAWEILQVSPPSNGNKPVRTRSTHSGNIAATTKAVVRRIEMYKYTGAYDATTHQAVCADGTCTAPSAGELGDALSAQNTAANVVADSLTVTRTGNGSVTGASGKIACGNACATFAPNGTAVTLTASPASGTIFGGWTGGCSGTQLSCTVTVAGQVTVGASFKSQFTLSVGRSNPGTVSGSPAGNDRALDCGSNCSAKFTDGTAVVLTATPPAGKTFVNWSGGCSGTSPTCTVVVSKDTSVQAVFSK